MQKKKLKNVHSTEQKYIIQYTNAYHSEIDIHLCFYRINNYNDVNLQSPYGNDKLVSYK